MRNKLEIKINENWTFRKVSDKKWLKAQVPGCVHTDLYYSKIIPDPFYGTNEKTFSGYLMKTGSIKQF